ncbi:prolyl oligopeptidase family serine peptidase [Phocaeicola sp.]
MKKHILLCCGFCMATLTYAQKKPLDHSVYDDWKRIANTQITPKGEIMSYEILPQEGDGKLVIRNTRNQKEITIERGYNTTLTPDGKFAICRIKPPFQATRQAKIKKATPEKLPKDSLAVINLATWKINKFAEVLSYKTGEEAATEVAFICVDTTLIPKGERKKKELGKPLVVYHFSNERTDTLYYVDKYAFDKTGKTLATVIKEKKNKSSVCLYQSPTYTPQQLAGGQAFYSLPSFDESGNKLLFLASADTIKSGSKHCELYYYEKGESHPSLLIDRAYKTNLPQNWGLTENSHPYFSRNGKHIFVGIAPIQAPKDTTLIPFETASLDLWHYADSRIQPMQLKNLKQDLKQTCLATYNAAKKELVPLTTSFFDSVHLIDSGNAPLALSIDKTKHMIELQWDEQLPSELSLVDLTNSNRIPIATGKFTRVTSSPDGKYILWYDREAYQWYIYDIQNASTLCLTDKCNVNFWDETNDRPQYPNPYGLAGWTEGDKDVLLYDRYDIWKFSTDGKSSINLTAHTGRQMNRVFRYIDTQNIPSKEKSFIKPNETILLSIFDQTNKKNGFATLKVNKSNTPAITILDGYTFAGLRKAKDAEVYLYQKENFNTSPDLYITQNLYKEGQKLTDINPQMREYNWGTAELFKWNAYDGTPLEGLLYKPEDFDPAKKYPVIMYFYERKSNDLYKYYAPAPSRSTVNIPFYCSRGYLVFVPDIVYTAGVPGECAYNCIVSGAESLAKNPWVDKANMAIQGQSWGGYQVAYLVTRTHLFKAAGAGAPVSNMTSAYGGIRWGEGSSRQFQYEHTQSRIGRNLWDAPELYITNSPLFRADKVETPLLIMHNDNDGAVPWYQGIEYFMALRRLGKKVWMLQYNNEEHNLTQRRNQKDLSIRLQQYFDYYLKGAPMPAWMRNGIPATRKGEYFGLETEQ